jgi:PTS system mannose-specific IIA component
MTLRRAVSLAVLALNDRAGRRRRPLHWAPGAWPAPSCRSASRPWARRSGALAGRALSAFNLVMFSGVFCMQWGIGLASSTRWPRRAVGDATPSGWPSARSGLACEPYLLLPVVLRGRRGAASVPIMAAESSRSMPGLLIVAHPAGFRAARGGEHTYPDCARHGEAAGRRGRRTEADASSRRGPRCAAGRCRCGDTLILTDVFGATPCNAAMRVADGVRVRVVTGVNVPMLWRTLCYRDEALDDLVAARRRRRHAGRDARAPPATARTTADCRRGRHDQVQHHHQQ